MSANNSCHFIGNLGRDPEMRYTPKGVAQTTFSVAVREDGKDKDRETLWMKCIAWGKQAETAQQLLHKGDQVAIEGRLQAYSYERDGQKRSGVELILDSWQKLSRKSEAGEAEAEAVSEGYGEAAPF